MLVSGNSRHHAAATRSDPSYHDSLQPLPNFSLTVLALLDLLLEQAHLISPPTNFGLSLLATQHSPLQRSIGCLAIMSTGLDSGECVELVDLIMDGTVSRVALP